MELQHRNCEHVQWINFSSCEMETKLEMADWSTILRKDRIMIPRVIVPSTWYFFFNLLGCEVFDFINGSYLFNHPKICWFLMINLKKKNEPFSRGALYQCFVLPGWLLLIFNRFRLEILQDLMRIADCQSFSIFWEFFKFVLILAFSKHESLMKRLSFIEFSKFKCKVWIFVDTLISCL